MNEQIRQWSKQAQELADTYGEPHDPVWFYFYNKQFAELIARECMSLTENFTNRQSQRSGSEQIAKYFGVEL